MKSFLKIILKYYLKSLAKLVLFIHRPTVIAIAGSTNKSFAKNEIKKRLEERGLSVWTGEKNFNTEIGLPLSILRIPESGYNSYRNWLPVILKTFSALVQKNYPDILILELGVSRPGDMKYLLSIIRPDISVITDITQRYLESFSGMDNLVSEYRYLADHTKRKGLVVLNSDNPRLASMSETKGYSRSVSFGHNDLSGWRIKEIQKQETGQRIVVENKKADKKYFLPKFGVHNVYALVSALAVEEEIFSRQG